MKCDRGGTYNWLFELGLMNVSNERDATEDVRITLL
jgi:hypothetical protein